MRVSSLDIQGFKSFAKKTRIELTDGITAVIGPNGSGKSCVVDAIRWVLGEQSVKQLRGKASTDIIFHGSEMLPQARKAEVTVTFDNESGRFPVQSATVAVTRVLTRGGESSYLVNNEEVRLLDLQQMLAEAGIGVKTFTVISQGMVDKYVTSSPQARKELFDDATGIKPLQLKLTEAHRKLRKTQQHATELETTLRELEPRLKVLARQIKRYAERSDLKKTFSEKQAQWFLHSWHMLEQRISELFTEEGTLEEAITKARTTRETVEQKIIRGGHAAFSALDDEIARAKQEFASAKAAYEKRAQEREKLESLITSAQAEYGQAQARVATLKQQGASIGFIETFTGTLKLCRDTLGALIKSPRSVSSSDMQVVLDSVKRSLSLLEQSSPKSLITSAADELAEPMARLAAIKATLDERNRQLLDIPILHPPQDTRIKELEAQKKHNGEASTENLPEQLAIAREQELTAERSMSAVKAALDGARIELHELEEEILREQGTALLERVKKHEFSKEQLQATPSEEELRKLNAKLAALGEPDPMILNEYEEVRARYTDLQKQFEDVRQAANNIVDIMGNLHTQMQRQFGEKFSIIRKGFSEAFISLFGGGEADLALSEHGVEISVALPGKRTRHIELLSGGERALTSLALLMGILEAQSPPFIVLDEVDAALDEANSERFAHLLRDKRKNTQCIVVTHNRAAMGVADVLYGITMQQKGVSSVYSVKLSELTEAEVGEGHKEISI